MAMAKGLVTKDTKVYAVFYSGLDTYYVPVYITQGNKDVSQFLHSTTRSLESCHGHEVLVLIPPLQYKVDKLPGPDYNMPGQMPPLGQTYVVLSTADGKGENKAKDENIISGVGILEILKK